MNAPSPPILEVEDVGKHFGGVQAVDGVSFAVRPGEILGIIGPNGSGKTTLINLITGFVRPDRGRVRFQGREITRWPPHRIARLGIARTFQLVRPFAHLPLYKNLVIPLYSPRVRGRTGGRFGQREAVALDLLEEVGFERDSAYITKPAGALPHGYLKRLELARCLALRPRLLLLDELFSGVSASEAASLIPLLEKLQMEGMTLVLVEHRLRELFRLTDRVLVLNFGRLIAQGSPEEVLQDPAVKAAYLGASPAPKPAAPSTSTPERPPLQQRGGRPEIDEP